MAEALARSALIKDNGEVQPVGLTDRLDSVDRGENN